LTAIHGCPNGKLLESAETKDELAAAVREGEAVARALGIEMIGDPLAMTLDVCSKTARNLSSMLQDVNNKRLTEIESINGAIVASGKNLGIPTPVNDELVRKVREMEQSY
jgi:2-dehydropantoate 2-reductase